MPVNKSLMIPRNVQSPALILLCTFLNLFRFFKTQYVSNQIYYQEPILNIKFMNLTLAGSFPLTRKGELLMEVIDETGLAAAICQADKLNRKQYSEINFNGIINIAAQYYNMSDSIGQFAAMSLFKNSLYNDTTKETLSSNGINNLAGFFGVLSTGVNKIHAQIISGNFISFVGPGTNDEVSFADQTFVSNNLENKTYYSIRQTSIYTAVNVTLEIMKSYGWTICGNIFQDNIVGSLAEQQLELYAFQNPSPFFTCKRIINSENFYKNDQFISDYCTCMNNIDTLTVINLWTEPIVAYSLIAAFKTKCSTASKFVFIMTGESKPLPPNFYKDPDIYKTTLVIRPFGPWNFTAYIDECLATSSPQAVSAVSAIINEFLLKYFNCYNRADKNSILALCPNSLIVERTQPCICSGTEFDPAYNVYSAQNFFFADAISTYAHIISLIQNNCSYVNEMAVSKKLFLIEKLDFCKLENLTPSILTEVLTLTNFTGYTGNINFPKPLENVRSYKTFYLYNVQSTLRDIVLVGNFSTDGYYLNKSAIILPSGNNTISELVPQNPGINYAVIAVFFGILIALFLLSIITFVYLIININNPLIRRNTPNMSIVVLVGVMLFLVGNIIICTGLYNATCILYVFFTNTGLALIIGGIIAKSYRIYRIFGNQNATAIAINDVHLFLIVFIFVVYFLIISALITITGQEALVEQGSTNQFYLFVRCVIANQFWNTFLTIWNELSFVFFRLFALFLAWSTRRVVSIYSESNSVMALITLYVCIDICFLPLYYTIQDGTDSAILRSCIYLIYSVITAIGTLILLFFCRIYQVHQRNLKLRKRFLNRSANNTNANDS